MHAKSLTVTNRRGRYLASYSFSEFCQLIRIRSQFRNFLYIFIPTLCDPLGKPGIVEVSCGVPPCKRGSGFGNHRNSHPERLTGCESAGVRPWIKCYIHPVVAL